METAAAELVFGKYEVLRRLAVGGMGEIFLARQHGVAGFDRLVILKSLLPDLAVDPVAVDQFLDEARVAATLNHPNIVGIYEVGEWQGGYIIAMEHVRGESISRIMVALGDDRVRVPAHIACRIVHDAALALDHSHSATADDGAPLGIVHRDVSPQNIMVRYDGVTKVLDFGIAKAANRASHTATGQVKGKISYMSPEQATGADVDRLSDQFSLGVVFWEMLVGARLFHGQNPLQSFVKLTKDPIPRLSLVSDNALPGLEDVLARMLERDRGARFESCRDVASALERVLDATETPSTHDAVERFLGVLREDGRLVDLSENAQGSKSLSRSVIRTPSPSRGGSFAEAGTPHPPPIPLEETNSIEVVSKPRRSPMPSIVGWLVVLVSAGAAAWWWASGDDPAPSPAVPASAGEAAPEAVVAKDSAGTLPASRRKDEGAAIEIGFEGEAQAKTKEQVARARSDASSPVEPKPKRTTRTATTKPRPQPVREKPRPAVPANAAGFLSIKTKPWTQVTIDGARHGLTPVYRMQLPVGKHVVRLRNEDAGIDIKKTVVVKMDETAKLDLDL